MNYVILYVISAEMAQNMYHTFGKTVNFFTNNEVLIFRKNIFCLSRLFIRNISNKKEVLITFIYNILKKNEIWSRCSFNNRGQYFHS